MDWLDEARARLNRKNQVLFAKDAAYLQDLTALFWDQDHRTMVLWAMGLAADSVAEPEEKYPGETRPREALEAAPLDTPCTTSA